MARKSAKKYARPKGQPSWAVIGVDTSVSSMAGAVIGFDGVLGRGFGPHVHKVRWQKGTHFLDRLAQAAGSANFIQELLSGAGAPPLELSQIFIGVEEAWPAGIAKRAESAWLRQQAQVTGAFMGGLTKYGYQHPWEVNAQSWKNVVRALGFPKPDKFLVKEWALATYPQIPDLPDLIQSKDGLKPKPDTSKAKSVQPEDIYDALGIMAWLENETEELRANIRPGKVSATVSSEPRKGDE